MDVITQNNVVNLVSGMGDLDRAHFGDGVSELEIRLEELRALCRHALYIRSWWATYASSIAAADRRAAAQVHDHMVDMAMFARTVGRAALLDLEEDEIRKHVWAPQILAAACTV